MKKIILFLLVLVVMVMIGISGVSCKAQQPQPATVEELQAQVACLNQQLEQMEAQLQGTIIVGGCYFDTNGNFALDAGDNPADGVILELYSLTELRELCSEAEPVAEAMVEYGMYRFNVPEGTPEGEYRIIVCDEIGPYKLQDYYSHEELVGYSKLYLYEGRDVFLGPIFLLWSYPEALDELG